MLNSFATNKSKPSLLSGDTYSGRRLYEAHMICGQNRRPVQTLVTAVVSGVQGSPELPVPLHLVLEVLTVDGTTVLLDGNRPQYDEVLYADENEALLKVSRDKVLLVQLAGNIATVTTAGKATWDSETGTYRLDDVSGEPVSYPDSVIYPNGRGILYWPQRTLLRLEEVHETLHVTTPIESVLFIRGGGLSADAINNRIQAELSSQRPVMRLSAGEELDQPSYSGLSQRLLAEAQILRSEWLEATYDYSMYPNESGVARRMLMQKFIAKTEELKTQCQEIYAGLGFTDLKFRPIDLTDANEDTAAIDLLDRALAGGVITDEEYVSTFRDLLGLGELTEGVRKRVGINPSPDETQDDESVV